MSMRSWRDARPTPRGERGAASVEAAIVAPVMILVFTCVLFMLHLYSAKLRVLGNARREAWALSAAACKGASVRSNRPQSGRDTVEATRSKLASGTGESNKIVAAVQSALDAPLGGLFGESVSTSASQVVTEPGLLGSENIQVAGSYHLVCNIEARDLGDLALDIWNKVRP